MKRLMFLILLAITGLSANKAAAQVSINVNIGSQPLWGPTGYDHVDYYYLPEIESYYYVPERRFVYLSNGNWIFSGGVPPRYQGYDLYRGYKVVINSPRPYRYFSTHKVKYAKYRSNHSQPVIRYSKSPKYYVVKGHPGNNGNGQFKAKGNSGKGHNGGNGKGGGKSKGGGKGKH
ncbi:MAG TPA: hypothetical protein VK541_23005 [Pedobacter sp.]|uniref:hypothetical protein n=1 Tax=Pedobacter sp. TaxID=1411316 RepID=UPI002CE41A55|nr:hypothetical protein [Pedobacter sp.]HMI05377.1 hypothetical protein [Pedobacter sp.]